MAIDQPIMSVGASAPRERARYVVVKAVGAVPPSSYNAVIDAQFVTIEQPAERVGQIVYYRGDNPSNLFRWVNVYVVVEIDGVLQWKQAEQQPDFIDTYTGQKHNPNSGFAGA